MSNEQTPPVSDNAFNRFATYLERLPNKQAFKWLSRPVKGITRIFYNAISRFDRGENVTFMDYGYISFDPNYKPLELKPEQENFRYQIQMYHHIASSADWAGKDALEVGSGRGGGAAYIKQQFKPRSMLGVDLSDAAVEFCNRYHASVEGLRFFQGDAENLKFPDKSFDIIINVESSLYYPNVEEFFKHVVRLLRPNGYFLYADMRFQDELENWHKQLKDTGLQLLSEEDITKNAKQALSLNQEYRRKLVEKYAPKFLHRLFSRFGGSDGGRLASASHESGKRLYKKFVFRKNS